VLLNGCMIRREHVQALLNLLQTTSGSYLLMASLDIARSNLAVNGHEIFSRVLSLSRDARARIEAIPGLKTFGPRHVGQPGVSAYDETKLVVDVSDLGISGFEVYDRLIADHGIQLELADAQNVLAIVSLGDTAESVASLVRALESIARDHRRPGQFRIVPMPMRDPQMMVYPREAFYSEKVFRPLDASVGKIAAESVMAYPPGIPILAPGELITAEIVAYLKFLKTQHMKLTDMNDKSLETLLTVA
jgi:arginine/lysine/ornithine decarboxylase